MTLKLPRSYKPKLALREAALLQALEGLDLDRDGIVEATAADLSNILRITPGEVTESLALLNRWRCILLGSKEVAILLRLSTKLKQEVERNRLRTKRRGPAPDWTFHRRVLASFPSLRGPIDRPASYNKPAAFEPLLARHPHFHRKDCPADVEIITDACYPGELTTLLTLIEEQRSAHRHVVLLYTRKAVYVGVRRAPKR